MSTKTLGKRIALVAVSALGAGVLSIVAVPAANATITAAAITVSANGGTATTSQGIVAGTTGSALTGTSNTMSMLASGQIYLTVTAAGGSAASDFSKITVSGGVMTTCGATLDAAQTTCTSAAGTAIGTATVKPTAVGTPLVITSLISTDTGSTYTTNTVIVVSVVATSSVNSLSVSDSFFKVLTSAGSAMTNVDATWAATSAGSAAAAPGTRVRNNYSAYFAYNAKDSNGNGLSAPAVVATSTGGCLVNGSDTKGTQTSAYLGTATGVFRIDRPTTNAPATCTVTIAINGATASTRTFTFEGQLAKIALLASGIVKASSTASNSGVYFVDALDSAGNSLDGITISADSSYYNAALTTVSMSGNTAPYGAYATDSAITTITCLAKGSYKMQLKGTATDTSTIRSDVFTIKCAGTPVNYTASLDKSSYVPGDVATLTVTAKDSAGNATYDAATVGTGVAIAGSNMTAVSAPTDIDTFTDGVKKYKFIVGSTEGSYQMSVDLPDYNSTTYNQTAVTVPYTIKASSASVSNAEVLAAIVKLIASINKQISALQKALTKKK